MTNKIATTQDLHKTVLEFFHDKLANDLSIIVMNVQRGRDKLKKMEGNEEIKNQIDLIFREIQFKGKVATDRMKGASECVLNPGGTLEGLVVSDILKQTIDKIKEDPSKDILNINSEIDPCKTVVKGNKFQLSFLFLSLILATKAHMALKENVQLTLNVKLKENEQNIEVSFSFLNNILDSFYTSREFLIATYIAETCFNANLDAKALPEAFVIKLEFKGVR